ncbi:MAG: LysR family transcriptional regulator [Pseudomonadota bacterium]
MQVELRHLKAFCAVAEELSFRRASERLGVAQPALSRTIKNLEEEIGVTLFERTTRVTRLTEAGRVMLTRAQTVLEGLGDTVELAQRVQSGIAGEVRVGFNDFAITGLLPETVRQFRSAYPEVEVKLVDSPTPEMLNMVLDGELEVAFHTGPPDHADLENIVVRKERLVCVLPASHRLAAQSAVSVADLAGEPFIMGRWRTWRIYHRIVRDLCRGHGFQPRIIQEAEHSDGIMGLVAAEMGVTLYVDSEWIHFMKGIAVKPLREATPPPIDSFATWRRDRRASVPAIDNFLRVAADVVDRNGIELETPASAGVMDSR